MKCFLELIDVIKDSHVSLVGDIDKDFLNDSFQFSFKFKFENKDGFSMIQRWANNVPFSDHHIVPAEMTIESKQYLVSSIYPISISKNDKKCKAIFAYSLISEA
jgi:hypothetical protein